MADIVGTVGPEEADETFATNMRYLREQAPLSIAAFVRCLKEQGWETHATTITRIEKGEQRPRVGEAKAIAAVFGLTLDEMITSVGPQIAGIQREVSSFIDAAEAALEAGQKLMRPEILDLVGEVRNEEFRQLGQQFIWLESIVAQLGSVLHKGEGKALSDELTRLGVR
ncbi:MAG: helix-turn-helix domain-containing protein [Nocardiaceae bacterium]|nr:helix-turn-helix domain-containing protein [Nocardiaceae bacterium]